MATTTMSSTTSFAWPIIPLPAAENRLLVRDLAEGLLRDYAINRRKSLQTVRARWQGRLKPYFEQFEAESLTTDQIEVYVTRRLEEKAENATINRELAALKRMYALGIRSRKLAARPYIPLLRESAPRKGFLKNAQYHALARATAEHAIWLRAMFEVAYAYGCRKSELLNLKVRQVDLAERSIALDPGETKNNEGRQLPLIPVVLELVSELIAGKAPEDYVFTRSQGHRGRRARTGGRITDLREPWARACCAAGLGKMVCPGTPEGACRGEVMPVSREPQTKPLRPGLAATGKLGKARTGEAACSRPGCYNRILASNRSGVCWSCQLAPRALAARGQHWKCVVCGAVHLWGDLKYRGLFFHDLRRSAVRNLVRAGMGEKAAMIISGHKTRSVFQRYNILDQSDLDRAVKMLEALRAGEGLVHP